MANNHDNNTIIKSILKDTENAENETKTNIPKLHFDLYLKNCQLQWSSSLTTHISAYRISFMQTNGSTPTPRRTSFKVPEEVTQFKFRKKLLIMV